MARIVTLIIASAAVIAGPGCSFDPSAHGGVGDDGAPIDGPVIDATGGDAILPDGPLLDGPLTDGPLTDGPLTDGPRTDGPLADGAPLDGPPPDAGAPDAPAPDAASCDQPVHIRLSINGEAVPAGTTGQCQATDTGGRPYHQVIVGDTVTFDASDSCAQTGPLTFSWALTPNDSTTATIEPSASSAAISLYSLVPDQSYVVTLTATAPGGAATCAVTAFHTYGWQALGTGPGNGDVRDLAFGGGALWIAARDGAYFATALDGSFTRVDDQFGGDSVGADLATVWHADPTPQAWFGHKNNNDGVWRVDQGSDAVSYHQYDTGSALGRSAVVREIGAGPIGVVLATDKGLTGSPDNNTFVGSFIPDSDDDVRAYARYTNISWGGGRFLWNLGALATDIDALQLGGDNRIRAMRVYSPAGELWIASDGDGIALVEADSGAPISLWRAGDSGLAENRVRDLLLETSGGFTGDVWAATRSGVARYKRDRELWILLDDTSGLGSLTDLRAIAIDSATRTIYAAGNGGIVYIRLP